MATSNEKAYLSWYYIYKIYYSHFRFEEAKSALEEFKKFATRHEKKLFNISKEEERLANAPKFFSKEIQTSIIDVKSTRIDSLNIILSDICHLKFETISVDKFDNIKMLVPPLTKLNEYLYFAASSNFNSKGKDIFRIKKIDHIKWSAPRISER